MHGNVQSYFGAEFETVRNGLGGGIDSNLASLDGVLLDAEIQSRPGEPDHTNRRIGRLGRPGPSLQRNPYFKRIFGGEIVKPKGGREADDGLRYFPRNLQKRPVLCRTARRGAVDSSGDALQFAGTNKPAKVGPRNSKCVEVFGTDDSLPTHEFLNPSRRSVHCPNVSKPIQLSINA